ncbi:MAG: AbrB/MazE/SpoVT family DNA-binding domain-containing protein [Hydrogenophaga sp.]|uniref:AbrB/MazE/SpoVT family DNA-binding domain-containing protein n=1 Tax=Hydrogenophaga sp. TaxID=1904254 RepID=UPI002732CB25|nr:AbrB/MazE/SpoVT family DNA-binding domain-containing protein [Hydrogenophaga sp.]MDP3348218.1 AbrB/MazE/SpoVT family DNA-binding domain-containing protein [Hydrogenophaga sp.]
MTSTTINSKGQITIPARVRQALAVNVGDRIEFVEIEPGQFLLVPVNRSITELKGAFGKPGTAMSIKKMSRAAAAQA